MSAFVELLSSQIRDREIVEARINSALKYNYAMSLLPRDHSILRKCVRLGEERRAEAARKLEVKELVNNWVAEG